MKARRRQRNKAKGNDIRVAGVARNHVNLKPPASTETQKGRMCGGLTSPAP